MPSNIIIVMGSSPPDAEGLGERLTKWLIFTAAFSCLPVLANLFFLGGAESFRWPVVIGRGELFMIAAAICGDGISRVLGRGGWRRSFCVGALMFILAAACLEFGFISSDLSNAAHDIMGVSEALRASPGDLLALAKKLAKAADETESMKMYHVIWSLVIFGCSVAAGFAAVILEG